MDKNKAYANYMLAWIEKLNITNFPELSELKAFWRGNDNINLEYIRNKLWGWVDSNGGPRLNSEQKMLAARMALCLSYEDNRELEL